MAPAGSVKVEETFKKFDKNGDGKISRDEFADLFKSLDGKNWNPSKIDRLFDAADTDRSGTIDVSEFLNWVFAKKAGRAVVSKVDKEEKFSDRPLSRSKTEFVDPVAAEHSDSSSSSSSSSEDESSRTPSKRANSPAPKPKKLSKKRRARPVITAQAFYESLTMEGGVVGARLSLGVFANLFARCKRAGLNPDFPRLVPQNLEKAEWDAEDVSAFEIGHLFCMLQENPDATEQEAMAKIEEVRDACRDLEWDREESMTVIGLDPQASIGYNVFLKLVNLLSATTLLDEDHLLSQLYWAHTDCFQLTYTMACEIMERLFLKVADKGESVLQIPIKGNDFMRMCHVQSLSDNSGKNGIPHAQLSLFFQSTCQGLPRLLEERDRQRGIDTSKKVREHHTHKSISGRIKLGILFNQLFKAMPPDLYMSPLHMVLSLLEIADAVAVKP